MRHTSHVTLLLIAGAMPLWAQDPPLPRAMVDTTPMVAAAQWATDRFAGNRTTLAFALSRPLSAGERLALIVGTTDVSATVRVNGTRAEYVPAALPLPAGESEALVYVVAADGRWREAGRAVLRVRTRAGFDRAVSTSSIDLASSGQLHQHVAAGAPPPDRQTYQDLTLRVALGESVARSGWEAAVQSTVVGVTDRTQRLRWNERQARAPSLDLADYRLQLSRGAVRGTLGNISVGANRYLLSGFGSRGASAAVQLHRAIALDAAAVNGTNVVGWDNAFGLAESDHRLLSTALNVEFLPRRPGALHVDVSALDGSVLPRTGFTQGAVTDAERSRGYGVQVSMSDAAQRVRFAGGFAHSHFRNPSDPLLAGDTTLVPVRSDARSARFGELGLQLLNGHRLVDSLRLSLSATVRHERVDPLYRSVGAPVQGDQQLDGGDLTATLGPLSIQGAVTRGRDNLADIPSILTTRTRRRTLALAAPLGGLLGLSPRPWLPVATLGWEGTGQAGDGIPVNSDFAATHVPNQFNRVRSASLTWSPARLSVAYRWNESLQDNRQVGRERADFRTRIHALSVGLNVTGRLTPSLEASIERQDNLEAGTQLRTSRVGSIVQAQLSRTLNLSGNLAHTWAFDPFANRRTRNLEVQGELSQGFTLYRPVEGGTQGRVFVRYARTRAAFFPVIPDPSLVPQLMWTVNAGSSLRLF